MQIGRVWAHYWRGWCSHSFRHRALWEARKCGPLGILSGHQGFVVIVYTNSRVKAVKRPFVMVQCRQTRSRTIRFAPQTIAPTHHGWERYRPQRARLRKLGCPELNVGKTKSTIFSRIAGPLGPIMLDAVKARAKDGVEKNMKESEARCEDTMDVETSICDVLMLHEA